MILGIVWWHYVVWIVIFFIAMRINVWILHWVNKRNDVKFVKALQVRHPDSRFSIVTISGRDSKALEQIKAQLEMPITAVCACGHNLGAHPPDPDMPFAWPCRVCDCQEYKEIRR